MELTVEQVATRHDVLEDVANAAGALYGDMMAADEEPTHFNSWFHLRDSLGKLRIITNLDRTRLIEEEDNGTNS